MRLGLILAGVFLFIGGAAWGQTVTAVAAPASSVTASLPMPVYDVISVKPNKSPTYMMGSNKTPGGEEFTNWPLKLILYTVYGVRPGLIFGLPEWANTEQWDVKLKMSDPDMAAVRKLSPEQKRAMAAAALEDRFALKVHKEVRDLPLYDLVLSKGGLKMKQSPEVTVLPDQKYDSGKPGGGLGMSTVRGGNGQVTGLFVPMTRLIQTLSNALNQTVVDKSGLTGKYDFSLRYTPEGTPDTSDAPSIFTAVEEQLGLKLVPAKGPVQTLVVDHVERPTQN